MFSKSGEKLPKLTTAKLLIFYSKEKNAEKSFKFDNTKRQTLFIPYQPKWLKELLPKIFTKNGVQRLFLY